MTNEIAAFAERHKLNIAEMQAQVETGHWPTVSGWLHEQGVGALSRDDLDAITQAVAACRWQAWRPTPEPAAEPAPTVPDRDRIAAILNAPEAVGREASARHLALNTDLSSEDACALLAATPIARPERAAQPPQLDGHETTVALVPVRPDQAHHPSRTPAAESKSVWDNVIARMKRDRAA